MVALGAIFQNYNSTNLLLPSGYWNWTVIEHNLWPIDHDELRRIPMVIGDEPDILVWHHTSSGEYSAMWTRVEGSAGTMQRSSFYYRKMWYLKLPNKVKIHVWQALHEALALQGTNINVLCPSAFTLLKLVSMFSGSANGYKRFGRPQLYGRFYALPKVKLFLIFGVGM